MAAVPAAAGAAAAVNPWMALASPILGGFANGLAGGSAGPSTATLRGEAAFDSSGWNVNFGTGSIESSRAQAGELSSYMPYILVGAGLLIVWRMTRKS
jgi:hypothetical protein